MSRTVKIKDSVIGNGNKPYIIAEMACAHDGSLDKAKQLVDSAVAAGADAVQLQFFVPDETVTPAHQVYDVLKKIAFSPQQWSGLVDYARSKKIHVFVCTYDVPSVELAITLGADGIKLNSSDLSNPEVVAAVAKSGIPFTLGTGASTIEEIRKGVELAEANGAKNIILMYGVQNFPTRTEDLNILRIKLLQDNFDLPVGYHDHTDGEDPFAKMVELIAIGMGACVVEKHITIDRKEKGIDHQAALEPAEFKTFVATIHRAYTALGKKEYAEFTESDLRYRKFQKKSIVAARELKRGETITRKEVKFIRNVEPGLPPNEFKSIDGRKVNRDIKQFENIVPGDIQ